MMYVSAPIQVLAARKRLGLLRFYSFFERQGLPPLSPRLLVVGVSPVDRVSQQRNQPRSRKHPCNSLWKNVRGIQVGGGVSSDGHPPVLPPGRRKAPTVPLESLFFDEDVEVVQLFFSGGFDARVPGQ